MDVSRVGTCRAPWHTPLKSRCIATGWTSPTPNIQTSFAGRYSRMIFAPHLNSSLHKPHNIVFVPLTIFNMSRHRNPIHLCHMAQPVPRTWHNSQTEQSETKYHLPIQLEIGRKRLVCPPAREARGVGRAERRGSGRPDIIRG